MEHILDSPSPSDILYGWRSTAVVSWESAQVDRTREVLLHSVCHLGKRTRPGSPLTCCSHMLWEALSRPQMRGSAPVPAGQTRSPRLGPRLAVQGSGDAML